MNRFKMIASGYVFFVKDNQILLMRRKNTGFMDGKYGLPSGHIEESETLTNGALREIFEEVGVKLEQKSLQLVHVMHRKGDDIRMDFFFLAKTWKGEPHNKEPEKCDDLTWFPLDKLPQNIIPYIKLAIEQYQAKNFYSEVGWKEKNH